MPKTTLETMTWDDSSKWYKKLVGEKGHHYHQTVIFPKLLRLIRSEKIDSWLDLGCGTGLLQTHLPPIVEYIGIDNAKKLLPKTPQFLHGDVSQTLPLKKQDFSHASFILSLQNIEDGAGAIEQASKHLRPQGKLYLVLNHPCFRIPRQSDWGFDENTKIQYRRINAYMQPMKIPITTHPGKTYPGKEKSPITYTYHHPLSTYIEWLHAFSILHLEEWCSEKQSEGTRAKAEDRARKEIPLFLTFVAEKK